ncbi:MAG: dienelactone hydrolase family protein [Elusimicrobia bacterium]|nr:dienelactone hydrolase family protein [Elusimicrobiota bacterium]
MTQKFSPGRKLAGALKIGTFCSWNNVKSLSKQSYQQSFLAPLILSSANVTIETLQMGNPPDASTAYFLVPGAAPGQTARYPAVIVLHGHLSHASDLVGITTSTFVWPAALTLVHQGFAVLVPEVRWEPNNTRQETKLAFKLMLGGKTLLGERVADVLRHLDYLTRRPDVDARRIGAAGWSMGGNLALFAAALDKRIKVLYLSSCFGSFKSLLDEKAAMQTPDTYVPFLLEQFGDKTEAAILVKPRPILIEHGLQDAVEPFDLADQNANRLFKAYGNSAKTRLYFIVHRFGHKFYGAEIADWFSKWLK